MPLGEVHREGMVVAIRTVFLESLRIVHRRLNVTRNAAFLSII